MRLFFKRQKCPSTESPIYHFILNFIFYIKLILNIFLTILPLSS